MLRQAISPKNSRSSRTTAIYASPSSMPATVCPSAPSTQPVAFMPAIFEGGPATASGTTDGAPHSRRPPRAPTSRPGWQIHQASRRVDGSAVRNTGARRHAYCEIHPDPRGPGFLLGRARPRCCERTRRLRLRSEAPAPRSSGRVSGSRPEAQRNRRNQACHRRRRRTPRARDSFWRVPVVYPGLDHAGATEIRI